MRTEQGSVLMFGSVLLEAELILAKSLARRSSRIRSAKLKYDTGSD